MNATLPEPLSLSPQVSGLSSQISAVSAKIDKLETALTRLPPADMPLVHTFTPHLYGRQIFMPAGTLVISRTHNFEHQFVISQGEVSVWDAVQGVVRLKAPYHGVTKPGARRILYIHEDCIWTTFHVTDETDPETIVAQVTEPHEIAPDDGDPGIAALAEAVANPQSAIRNPQLKGTL